MSIFDVFNIKKIKQENLSLKQQIQSLGVTEYFETKQKMDKLVLDTKNYVNNITIEATRNVNESNQLLQSNNSLIATLNEQIITLRAQEEKLVKSVNSNEKKLYRIKELYKSMDYSTSNYINNDYIYKLSSTQLSDAEQLAPSVDLKLHCMDMNSLRKAYRDNEKSINKLLQQYSSRYTTKSNIAIYNLMVIALRAELQNILYNLKYDKLEISIQLVKSVSTKYLKIAGDGNQSIVNTLTKFIGELEYFFIEAVKIEYNYYVKKEQARQEQLAIKEQMRVENEERKALEAAKKKIEQEESKYTAQIVNIKEQLLQTNDSDELSKLNARILELEAQLYDVSLKKEEISNLQNGKAGNVYIISNLGAFGENMFKIGMTRRLDPQDRVNELGDASVPFRFDVHSFIFSEDASQLETELHKRLDNKRVNKVNSRKEFFYSNIEELEALVNEICPTAEFNKTMIAEEFRQSQSSDENYSSSFTLQDEDE